MRIRDTHLYMLTWGVGIYAATSFFSPILALSVVRGASVGLVLLSLFLLLTDDPQGRP